MDLQDKIKLNRPDISDKNADMYAKRIIKLAKDMGIKDNIVENPQNIANFLEQRDIKVATKRAYLEALMTLIPKENTELLQKYKTLRHQYYSELYQETKNNKPIVKGGDNQDDLSLIINIINNYYTKLTTLEDEKEFTIIMMEFLILITTFVNPFSLYINEDNIGYLYFQRVKSEGKKFDLGIYTGRFDLKDGKFEIHKNKQSDNIVDGNEPNIIELSKEFNGLMKKWAKINPTNFLLFRQSTKEAFGNNFRNCYEKIKKTYPEIKAFKISTNRGRISTEKLGFKIIV